MTLTLGTLIDIVQESEELMNHFHLIHALAVQHEDHRLHEHCKSADAAAWTLQQRLKELKHIRLNVADVDAD